MPLCPSPAGIPFPTRVGTCGGSTVQSCDGWASGQFCSGCTIRALYKVATRAIPYLHPATDYPTRDARITMAAVATYWSLREGVFNKIYNIDGYNNCETCASGNNYQAPLYSCNTLACAAASCPAKRRQCTWQVGPGAVQVSRPPQHTWGEVGAVNSPVQVSRPPQLTWGEVGEVNSPGTQQG